MNRSVLGVSTMLEWHVRQRMGEEAVNRVIDTAFNVACNGALKMTVNTMSNLCIHEVTR